MVNMINCKSCGVEIAASAKSCPKCGAKNKKPIWKRVCVFLAVILLFSVIGGTDSGSDTNVTDPSIDTNTPVVQEPINYTVVSVANMMNALNDNALKAEKTYDGQYLEITGRLGVIDSDGSYVSLYGGDFDFIGIQCFIKNDEQLNFAMNMVKGDTYTIRVKVIDVGEILGYQANIIEFVK